MQQDNADCQPPEQRNRVPVPATVEIAKRLLPHQYHLPDRDGVVERVCRPRLPFLAFFLSSSGVYRPSVRLPTIPSRSFRQAASNKSTPVPTRSEERRVGCE